MRWIAMVLALSGCSHVAVFAQPRAIANHATELRGRGYAQVEVEQGGTIAVDAADVVTIAIPGNETSHLWGLITTGTPDRIEELSIGTLVAGCGPDRPGSDCLAARARGPVRVGTQRRVDATQLAIGHISAGFSAAPRFARHCLANCRRERFARRHQAGLEGRPGGPGPPA